MSLDRLGLQLLMTALVVSALRAPSAAGANVLWVLFGHAHYLVGGPICLLLVFIIWSINLQSRLYIDLVRPPNPDHLRPQEMDSTSHKLNILDWFVLPPGLLKLHLVSNCDSVVDFLV